MITIESIEWFLEKTGMDARDFSRRVGKHGEYVRQWREGYTIGDRMVVHCADVISAEANRIGLDLDEMPTANGIKKVDPKYQDEPLASTPDYATIMASQTLLAALRREHGPLMDRLRANLDAVGYRHQMFAA